MTSFTSAAELALAKRKHATDMGSVQRSTSTARSVVVMGDGGAVAGVVPQSAVSPKRTSAAEFRYEKAHHKASYESPPRTHAATDCHTNSFETLREQKVKHHCKMPCEREGVLIGDEDETPNPKEDTKLVSFRQLTKEKRHHRHNIGTPDNRDALNDKLKATDGPQGSQRQLSKLKRNHDHTLQGEFNGCSPQREQQSPIEDVDPTLQKKSCVFLTSKKRHHDKDMSVPKTATKCQHMSNEEYNYDKKRHRHTVDEASPAGSPSSLLRAREVAENETKCTSHRRMDRKKHLHSHNMDTHRTGYSASPQQGEGEAAKVKSNRELHASTKRCLHAMDGSPQKSPAAVFKPAAGIPSSRAATAGRANIFESVPPPTIANDSAAA
ncbi:hypothetical protein DIPPA_33465 [Diplonema papillatum]|nr:hypothetical protein DIPPA_33465 [Diplonema papillatum]